MRATVFNPEDIEVGPIGPLMASKTTNPDLIKFIQSKGREDGNLSAIVVGDSEKMGVGVGTWDKGQKTDKPVPLMFDEVLFIVNGAIKITIEGKSITASQGQVVHLHANQMVLFEGLEDNSRLVWVTTPPTWKALEAAFNSGKMATP